MNRAEDALAIQNVKARYCAAADLSPEDRAGAHRRLKEVFADSIVADYGLDKPIEGGEALAVFLSDIIAANSQWLVHNIHSPQIEVDGDRATGDWTVNARMKRKNGDLDMVIGRYSDEFVREAGGWKIVRVGFRRYE